MKRTRSEQSMSLKRKNPGAAGPSPAARSGSFAIGGRLTVYRLGFGAMQITGPDVWGEPADRNEAVAVLRRTVELGINLFDTADSYGPYVSEEPGGLVSLSGWACDSNEGGLCPARPWLVDTVGASRILASGM